MKINSDDKIETPEHDVSNDVFEKIHPKNNSRIILKRVLIVSVVICLCITLLILVKQMGLQRFNLLGEKTGSSYPVISISNPFGKASAIDEYNRRFMEENANGEARILMDDLGDSGYITSGGNADIRTDDYNIITDIMSINKSSLKLPTYIPGGYSFSGGKIDFFINDDNPPELISSEQKNGHIYLIYKLSEGYKENVSSMKLTYTNKNGDIISYDATLSEASMDNLEYYFPNSATIKILEIPSFDNAIWVYDKKQKTYLNSVALFKYIPKISTIDFMNITNASLHPASTPVPEINAGQSMFISINCHISSDVLDVEELVKIAESLN